MNRPLESFEYLNRGWDVRVLEQQSLRSVFVLLLVAVFMFGMLSAMVLYGLIRLHHVNWSNVFPLILFALSICRYSPIIYRRLGR